MFQQGESLADICAALGGLHLYTVVMSSGKMALLNPLLSSDYP